MPKLPYYFAFDFGMKKIGIAVGQLNTKSASALKLLPAHDGIPDWNALDSLMAEWQPAAFILGIPLNMDDTEQEITHCARKFGKKLATRYGCNVFPVDERLSTIEARERVRNDPTLRRSKKQRPVDALAAQILLEDWLSQVKLYGLIGSPVCHSPGPDFHNQWFIDHHETAIYHAWDITTEQLDNELTSLKPIVQGLSITMPFKETILRYLDAITPDAKMIGAVNTIVVQDKRWIGHNTDGDGAINALGCELKHQVINLLGAGGAARAIAYTAHQRGAHVNIFNRHKEKAALLANGFSGTAYHLDDIPHVPCDILINALPFNVTAPLTTLAQVSTLVMDITHLKKDSWLKPLAERHKIRLIDKMAMFKQQALLQQALWHITKSAP